MGLPMPRDMGPRCGPTFLAVRIMLVLSGIAVCTVYVLYDILHVRDKMGSGGTPRSSTNPGPRLAVVVPTHAEDSQRALRAIREWPSVCHFHTQGYTTDLILYCSDRDDHIPTLLTEEVIRLDSPCFATVKVVYGHLPEEEHFFPNKLSVQFYKMFFDVEVSQHFSSYRALVLLQWEANVAHDSFERLYRAAFANREVFGVKGITLTGPNMPISRYVVGHLDTIYKSFGHTFADFLDHNRDQRNHILPSSSSIPTTATADSPYTWLLWQRYSHNFLAFTLTNSTGSCNMNSKEVQDGADVEISFLPGSNNDQGSNASGGRASLGHPGEEDIHSTTGEQCLSFCGSRQENLPLGVSTVCDSSCLARGGELPRFGGYLCGAGDTLKYGESCRLCYTDLEEAQIAEEELRESRTRDAAEKMEEDCVEGRHVIMCDTLAPPPARGCHSDCTTESEAVCDMRCKDEHSESMNCNWRGNGVLCRPCFTHVEVARAVNIIAREEGRDTVIMCDTHEPPLPKTCKLRKDPGVVVRK